MSATLEKKVKKTKKPVVKRVNPLDRARSEVVRAVYGCLDDRRKWVSLDTLTEAASPFITTKKALAVYAFRHKDKPAPKAVKIARGKRMQVTLDCITLVRMGKIEQRGRGPTKEYRLL